MESAFSNNRKNRLSRKFREAGASGNKIHVIYQEGHWALFKEGTERVISKYPSKQLAIRSGKKMAKIKSADSLVIHKSDGSVDRIQAIE